MKIIKIVCSQRGSSLSNSTCTPVPQSSCSFTGSHACCPPRNDDLGGEGRVPPIFFCYLERHAKIQNRRQSPSGRKVSGSKEEERRRIMPSIVANTYASARTTFICSHSARTNTKAISELILEIRKNGSIQAIKFQ